MQCLPAIEALRNGEIQAGNVVFIIYQGVKAGPHTSNLLVLHNAFLQSSKPHALRPGDPQSG